MLGRPVTPVKEPRASQLLAPEPRGSPPAVRRPSPWVLLCGLGLCTGCAARTPEPIASGVGVAPPPPTTSAVETRHGEAGLRSPYDLADLARLHPALGDLAQYLSAQRAAARNDVGQLRDAVATLDTRWPDSIWRGRARLLEGRVHRRLGQLASARAALEAAIETLGERGPRDIARLALAEVVAAQGDPKTALVLVQRLRESRPRGLIGRRAQRLAARLLRAGGFDSADDRLADGELRLVEGDAAGALDQARRVLSEPVNATLRARARWLQARAHRALGHGDLAEATALALAADGDAAYAPRALAAVARWKWNADDDGAAAEIYNEILRRWPGSEETADALYALGRIRQEAGDHDGAVAAFMALAERFPLLRTADEARWRAGWVRYLAGEPAEAVRTFSTLSLDGDRRTRIAAEYWEARALEHLGSPEAMAKLRHLATRHPRTYYGALARARLGAADLPPEAPSFGAGRPPFPDELVGPHAERARIFHRAGFDRIARLELDAIASETPAEVLLQAYAAVEAPEAVIRVARARDAERRWLYPLGYWDVVRRYAEIHDLDPLLVTALIRQESAFAPDAVSPAQAHGLMQLLPTTASDIARAAGVPIPDSAALRTPTTNVALGTALLRRLLDRYQGSRIKALAAYNAGEEAVAKWERRYGERPEDEFVELISYRETREYVKAVVEHYEVYRGLYAASPSATSAGKPPKAPFDMMTMTSPGTAEATR